MQSRSDGPSGSVVSRLATGFVPLYFLLLYLLPPMQEYTAYRLKNFDFGMTFQSSYLLSGLRELTMSCRGVHAWADNQDYFQVVLAPFHWLGPLWVIGFTSLGIWSAGLFCLLWLRKEGPWVSLAAATAVWASPLMINMNVDLIHTESFATVLMLLLYAACKKGRAPLFYACLVLVLSVKEDVALTIGLFMLLAFFEQRRFPLVRRHFAIGLALSVVVFFVNLKLVLPFYKLQTCLWLDPSVSVDSMGSAPAAAAYADVLANWYKPSFLAASFLRADIALYVLKVIWPMLLFLRLRTWLFLLPAAGLFVNAVAESDHLTSGFYHYDFCTFAGVMIVVLEGLASTPNKRTAALLLAVGALVVNVGTDRMRTRLHAPFTSAFYDVGKTDEVRFLEGLEQLLPEDAVVSADQASMNYFLNGQPLTFMFKNPFEPHFFGLFGQCEAFATIPRVDLVVLKYVSDDRLESQRAILPPGFVEATRDGERFRVFMGPEFATGPLATELGSYLEDWR